MTSTPGPSEPSALGSEHQSGETSSSNTESSVSTVSKTENNNVTDAALFQEQYKVTPKLYAFGHNGYGQLGLGQSRMSNVEFTPQEIPSFQGHKILDFSCGDRHSTVVTDHGVYTFGDAYTIGNRSSFSHSTIPWHGKTSLNGKTIVQVSCGAAFTLALTHAGEVFSWGRYELGGHRSPFQVNYEDFQPRKLNKLKSEQVVSIAAGGFHALILCRSGKVFGFGENAKGQLGIGDDLRYRIHPVEIKSLQRITNKYETTINNVYAGRHHSAVTTEAGHLILFGRSTCCCSKNDLYFPSIPKYFATPSPGKRIINVHCGAYNMIVQREDGKMYSWGYGLEGMIGCDTPGNHLKPVSAFPQLPNLIDSISVGSWHTILISKTGEAYGVGLHDSGRLGMPPPDPSYPDLDPTLIKRIITDREEQNGCIPRPEEIIFNPVQIDFPKKFIAVKSASGAAHTLLFGYIIEPVQSLEEEESETASPEAPAPTSDSPPTSENPPQSWRLFPHFLFEKDQGRNTQAS